MLSHPRFGDVSLSTEETEFGVQLNNEILRVCKSIPKSLQTEAMILLSSHFDASLGHGINIIKKYYAPTWSIVYWLIKAIVEENNLNQSTLRNSKCGHSMAMFLHAFDDHLVDKELEITHLALLLRSQSWMMMNAAFKELANEVDEGRQIVKDNFEDYFSSICSQEETETLNDYCSRFKKQMATGMITPVLLAKMAKQDENYVNSIRKAYGSFGIAWRLLDDLQDIEVDMDAAVHSAVYFCLSKSQKEKWDNYKENKKECWKDTIFKHLIDSGSTDLLLERICDELEYAAVTVESLKLKGLGNEFRCMMSPLKKSFRNS